MSQSSSQKPNTTRPKGMRARLGGSAEVDPGFRWGSANSALLAAGVAVLAAGYVSLSKGSLTLAPVLLVVGYCVLIPASLLVRGNGSEKGE